MSPLGDLGRVVRWSLTTMAAAALAAAVAENALADTITDDPQTPWAECWTPRLLAELAHTPGIGYEHPLSVFGGRSHGGSAPAQTALPPLEWHPGWGLLPTPTPTLTRARPPLDPAPQPETHIPPIPVPALMPFLIGALTAAGAMLALRRR